MPTPFQRMLRQAARRDLYASALRRVGLWLTVTGALGLGVLALDRWLGWSLPWPVFAGIASAGVVGGMIHAVLSRRDRLDIAVQLDHSLQLQDRVGSALAMERAPAGFAGRDAAFTELLRRDAAALAGKIDVAAATPIHLTGVWGIALLVNFALLAGVIFLPNLDSQRREQSQAALAAQQLQQVQTQEQAERLAASIAQATSDLSQSPDAATDQAAAAQLEALDRLREQLDSAEAKTPEDIKAAREESAAHIDDLAEQLAQQAQRDLEAAEELQRRFGGMEARDLPNAPMTAQEFAEAVKRGDFGAASEQLERLMEESNGQYSQGERDAAAQVMRELAESIEKTAEQPDLAAAERMEHVREALRELGVDQETSRRLLDAQEDAAPLTPDEARNLLREHGIDEELAERLARDIENLREQQELQDQVQRDTRDVGEAIDRAADAVERGDPPPPPPPPQPAPPSSVSPPASAPSDVQRDAGSEDPAPPPTTKPSEANGDDARESQVRRPSTQPDQPRDASSEPAGQAPAEQQQQQEQESRARAESRSSSDAQTRPATEEPRQDAQTRPSEQGTTRQGTANQQQPSTQHERANESASRPQERQPSSSETPASDQPKSIPQSQPSASSVREPTQSQGEPQTRPPSTRPQNQQPQPASSQPDSPAQRQPPVPQQSQGDQASPATQPDGPQSQPSSDSSGERTPQQAQEQQAQEQRGQQQQGEPQQQDQATEQRGQGEQPASMPSPDQLPNQVPDQVPDPSQIPQPGENPAFDEVMRRLAERARDAQNQQEQSERLRELARQLADNMSPEQRRRWAEMLQREMGDPPPQSQASPPPDSPAPSPEQQPRDPDAPEQEPHRDSQDASPPREPENRGQGGDRQDPPRQPGDQQPAPPRSNDRDNPGGNADDRESPDARRSRDPQRQRGAGAGNEAGTQDAGDPPHSRDPDASGLERDKTDTVDLRGDESAERLIAQWLSDRAPDSADPSARATGSASAAAAQQVQQAQKVAERAVNDSAVNKRYHRLIQRYFGRLPNVIEQAARERAPGAASPPSAPSVTPAPPASPATPPSTQPS